MNKITRLLGIAILAGFALVACTTTRTVTNPDGSTNVVHITDPRLTAGLEAAKAANDISRPFNPVASLVDLGLLLTTGAAAFVAKRKNDRAAADQLLVKTLIQAVDQLGDPKVKEAIQTHAVRVGVEGELNQKVQQVGSGLI